MRSYHIHPTLPDTFIADDNNTRRRLKRAGWIKVYVHQMRPSAYRALKAAPVGWYSIGIDRRNIYK